MIKNVMLISMILLLLIGIMGCSNNEDTDLKMSETEANTDETVITEATEMTESSTIAIVNTINADKAMEMMASGDPYTLVDVRTKAEFDEGHIEGALLLPIDELETLAAEQLTDKEAVILVYCRSGNRSAQASALLAGLGYTNIYDFGGIKDWPGDIVK